MQVVNEYYKVALDDFNYMQFADEITAARHALEGDGKYQKVTVVEQVENLEVVEV